MNDEDECKEHDFWFSRTLCVCGSMHYYCLYCGQQEDPCDTREAERR